MIKAFEESQKLHYNWLRSRKTLKIDKDKAESLKKDLLTLYNNPQTHEYIRNEAANLNGWLSNFTR